MLIIQHFRLLSTTAILLVTLTIAAMDNDASQLHIKADSPAPFKLDATTIINYKKKCLEGHPDGILEANFSSNGNRILSQCQGTTANEALLWDGKTGEKIATLTSCFNPDTNVPDTFMFSPNSSRIAAEGKRTRLWNWQDGKEVSTLPEGPRSGWALKFSNDSNFLASGNTNILLSDGETGQTIKIIQGSGSNINALAFNSQGTRLFTKNFGNMTLYDVQTGKSIQSIPLTNNFENTEAIAFSPNGNQLICGPTPQNDFILLNTATGDKISQFKGNFDLYFSKIFSPNGDLIACRSEDNDHKDVYLYDSHTGHEVAVLTGHSNAVSVINFSPDNNLLVSGSQGETENLFLWNAKTQKKITELKGHSSKIFLVGFSPDNSRMFSLSQDKTILWNTHTGQQIWSLSQPSGLRLQFSPDSKLVFITINANRNNIIVLDAKTGELVATLQGHVTPVVVANFSPNSRSIVSGAMGGESSGPKNNLILWTLLTNKDNRLLKQLAKGSESKKTFIHELCDAKNGNQDIQPLIESEIFKSFSPTIQTWLKNIFLA